MNLNEKDRDLLEQADVGDDRASVKKDKNRLSEKTRASIWLALAVTVFLCAMVMCLSLIRQSADTSDAVVIETHIGDIQYVEQNPQTGDSGSNGEDPPESMEITAPISVNDSARFNYLIAALDHDTEQTDMLMILNIDTESKTAALLSIPRDTYVFDGYGAPKINRVYAANEDSGAQALTGVTQNMFGIDFQFDGYLIFDDAALDTVFEVIGDVDFDVPAEPKYHSLNAGRQKLDATEAFELFRYSEDYTDVETEPCQVQRDLMVLILDRLLQQSDSLLQNAQQICQNSITNISAETLAYFGQLLKGFRFADAYQAALPGGEIKVDGEYYYEVDSEKACERWNEYFNPLEQELTEHDANFRQKHTDSGVGVMPTWGHSTNTQETEPTEDTRESLPDGSEEPTEEDPTEEPSEDPTDTTQTPEPIEPAEPDGDE